MRRWRRSGDDDAAANKRARRNSGGGGAAKYKKMLTKKEEQKRQRKLDNDYFSISFRDIFFVCNDALLSFSFLFEETTKKNTEAQ